MAAAALLALRDRNEETEGDAEVMSEVGALLVAEFLALVRSYLTKK